MKDSRGV